jgi:hypothetical protein
MNMPWASGGAWTPAMLCESCRHARDLDCHCGLNAFAERSGLAAEELDGHEVLGVVELAGEVVQFEQGWRGELARPVELHVRVGQIELAQQLAATYGCPAVADLLPPRRPEVKRGAVMPAAVACGLVAVQVAMTAFFPVVVAQQWRSELVSGHFDKYASSVSIIVMPLIFAMPWLLLFIIIPPAKLRWLIGSTAMAVLGLAVTAAVMSSTYEGLARSAASSGRTQHVTVTSSNALSLIDAASIRPGRCKHESIGIGDPGVQVCRKGRTLSFEPLRVAGPRDQGAKLPDCNTTPPGLSCRVGHNPARARSSQ